MFRLHPRITLILICVSCILFHAMSYRINDSQLLDTLPPTQTVSHQLLQFFSSTSGSNMGSGFMSSPTSITARHTNGASAATSNENDPQRRLSRLLDYRDELNLNPYSDLARFNGRYPTG